MRDDFETRARERALLDRLNAALNGGDPVAIKNARAALLAFYKEALR